MNALSPLQPTQEDEDLLAQSNFWERIELPPIKVRLSRLVSSLHDAFFRHALAHE